MNMTQQPAQTILERDFLSLRHQILNVAAALDRIGRGEEAEQVRDDPRMSKIQKALAVLAEPDPGRAERVQIVFSREYDPKWRR